MRDSLEQLSLEMDDHHESVRDQQLQGEEAMEAAQNLIDENIKEKQEELE